MLDYVYVDRSEFEETGEYDLEGLFIRLGYAIDSIKAKRVVLDTIEGLFAGLPNQAIVRAELRRLFRWLKEKGVTVIMTGERGDGTLTRYGLEEYVSDCVISLDHRVVDQVTTRRIRVVKYRGTTHGTNEYPFLIEKDGISIWPITTVQLEHTASHERIPTGIERLDTMLGGKGFYRGSSILLSGTAGTGKTSVAATFADATCRRGERCLYFSFEESPSQIMRNMGTIGLDLQQWVKKGRLQLHTVRPFSHGLETHLARKIQFITEFAPHVVIIDPISGLDTTGTALEIKAALMRLMDWLKLKGITVMLTDLTMGGSALERADAAISSLVDTWLVLRDLETNGERNRGLHILKSRAMGHSNQVREFMVTNHGIQLTDVYIGPSGMLTGSARVQQEGRERAELVTLSEEAERQQLGAGMQTRRARSADRRAARGVFRRGSHHHAHRQQGQTARRGARPRRGGDGPQPQGRRRQSQRKPGPPQRHGRSTIMKTPATSRKAKPAAATPWAWELRLYVAGPTPKSVTAFRNIEQLCEEHLAGRYHIEVIDLMKNPQLAQSDQILAVPTLVRKRPAPVRKIIGTLSNTERVLGGLDLRPHDADPFAGRKGA